MATRKSDHRAADVDEGGYEEDADGDGGGGDEESGMKESHCQTDQEVNSMAHYWKQLHPIA